MILALTLKADQGQPNISEFAEAVAEFLGGGTDAQTVRGLVEEESAVIVPVSGVLAMSRLAEAHGYTVDVENFQPAFVRAGDPLEAAIPEPYRMTNLTKRILGIEEGPVMLEMLPVILDAYRAAGDPSDDEEMVIGAVVLARLFVAMTNGIHEKTLETAGFGSIYKFVTETEGAVKSEPS